MTESKEKETIKLIYGPTDGLAGLPLILSAIAYFGDGAFSLPVNYQFSFPTIPSHYNHFTV